MILKLYNLKRCILFGYSEPIKKVIPKPLPKSQSSIQKIKNFLLDQEIRKESKLLEALEDCYNDTQTEYLSEISLYGDAWVGSYMEIALMEKEIRQQEALIEVLESKKEF